MMSIKFIHAQGDQEDWIHEVRKFKNMWELELVFETKTSGSTGAPKLIKHTKESMIRSAKLTLERFQLEEGYKSLLCLPIQFIAGKMMYVRSNIAHGELHVSPPTVNPMKFITEEYDFISMTPLQFSRGLEQHEDRLKLIKKILIGGAPISSELQSKIKSLNTNCEIYHSYGMTETITHIAIKPLNGLSQSQYFHSLPEVRLMESDRKTLVISADHLPLSPIITNDLVQLIDPSTFIWLGRTDDIINTGGLKVNPYELEQALRSVVLFPFFIGAIPDPKLGQKVVLIIECPDNKEVLIKIWRDIQHVGEKNHRPKELMVVRKMKLTKTGKLIRDLNQYELKVFDKPN